MSGQLRALKNRIRGVENTEKITRAMEMVAAAKLKRYQKLREQAAPYTETLEGVLKRLLQSGELLQHPLLEEREEKRTALLVITSDTGLCGSYNHGLVEEAKRFLKSRAPAPLLIGIGKNGVNALSRAGYTWFQAFADAKAMPFEFVITEIGLLLEELFSEKRVDAVYVVCSRLAGRSVFHPTTERLLPFTLTPPSVRRTAADESLPDEWQAGGPWQEEESMGEGIHYILEPSRETLFARLVPLVFAAKMRMIFIESMIAEHAARMNAMYQATENAKELTDALVLLRNKVRQAAITRELIEIVSGSRALKTG